MYDYLMQFTSETAAKRALPAYINADNAWRLDVVLPNVKCWLKSQDTGNPPVHNYWTGWQLVLSLPSLDQALVNLGTTLIVVNREKAVKNPDDPAAIIKTNYANTRDVGVEPRFMGMVGTV